MRVVVLIDARDLSRCTSCWLVGAQFDDVITVTSLVRLDGSHEKDDLRLPGGIRVLGPVVCEQLPSTREQTDMVVAVVPVIKDRGEPAVEWIVNGAVMTDVEFVSRENARTYFRERFVLLQVRVDEVLQRQQACSFALLVNGSGVILSSRSDSSSSSSTTLSDLAAVANANEVSRTHDEPLDAEVLLNRSAGENFHQGDAVSENYCSSSDGFAGGLRFCSLDASSERLKASSDASPNIFLYLPNTASSDFVLNAVCATAKSCCDVLAWFRPFDMIHVIGFKEPSDMDDPARRRRQHERWFLPCDRPLFRRENALVFPNAAGGLGATAAATVATPLSISNLYEDEAASIEWQPHALCVHSALSLETGKSPIAVGGKKASFMKLHMVRGQYLYYHYNQDGIADSGWGCAYRSLQTVASWFQLQNYAPSITAPPSHKEVQKRLVRLGDKEPSFVGSRQWIGSMEVGLVLQDIIGLEYKLMFVQSGADILSRVRELAMHFDTQGTPVMIGGGVLAYTLLGVAVDDDTGDAQFLILDPHFVFAGSKRDTHAENASYLQAVSKGKWCAWKGPELFKAKAFYNFCLPQRPDEI